MEPAVASLLEACVKLRCSLITRARALLYYHQFSSCTSSGSYDKNMVAAAALNLSSRVGEQNIDLDTLIIVFYGVVKKASVLLNLEDPTYASLKKSLLFIDYLMQRVFEFDINHRLAFQYLVHFLSFLYDRSSEISEFRQVMTTTCIKTMSDFYTSKLVLDHQPHHLTIAAIDLALRAHGLLPDTVTIQPWFQGICRDLSMTKLRQIKRDMLSVYEC